MVSLDTKVTIEIAIGQDWIFSVRCFITNLATVLNDDKVKYQRIKL